MPFTSDDLVCPKCQPNNDCLCLKHTHTPHTTEQGKAPVEKNSLGIDQALREEEKETSKEDFDEVSVVSSYCDVNRDSLCILSPGCDLYWCDGDSDRSSDSHCQDDSVSSVSATSEEEFLHLHQHRMTRLDPPHHWPNPWAWKEEAQSRERFGRHSLSTHVDSKAERDRESGYFSRGQAAGARMLRDKSPPPPHRHSERGHPLSSNRTPEPKATIPFRNPDLGIASHRRTTEIQNPDPVPPASYSPEPLDLSIEVEAQLKKSFLSHSHSKTAPSSWDEPGRQKAKPSSANHTQQCSRPSVHFSTSVVQAEEETIHQDCNYMKKKRPLNLITKPDLLNFKKGWMSKLDENGEWKKHWFVLTDAGLKYYRDSGAEEKEELDGEIDLRSCVKVSEFDVERNYGFQIETKDYVFTLSAMTAGIRRNWIEVLKKSIRPSNSPDLTQLPDSSDKENSRHPSSCHQLSQSETSSVLNPSHCRFDYVELSPVATPPSSAKVNQREAGEGQVRDHGQWQDERIQDPSHSQWEAVLQRKGSGTTLDQKKIEEEIERKWGEFERLPLKEIRSLPTLGSGLLANEALQREVASLRQQLEQVQGSRGVCGVCLGGLGCGVSLEQMEHAHRQALEELQRNHERQTAELKREKERLLQEETQATVSAMEALKKAHKEELEREVQKAKTLAGHTADTYTLRDQHQLQLLSLSRELQSLSERYSQKCLELNHTQQYSGEMEWKISHKNTEIEQLRKENQDLQTRLTEEIRQLPIYVTGQGSEEVAANDKKERPLCELEVLLRVKQNEVEYLHKEIMCLRNEVQFLNTEKQGVCTRYKDVCEELRGMKERSQQEAQTLKEHLRLAMAALQEGQRLSNSLQH
ncbi:hypothetical protein NFI96_018930 [Prochilodus magdalenae]|nr:hypothetical protein NFI96_018930 [Prochilodus magdalenae]